jgi:drug/metabolite transporter (DMT)-like permease
VRWLAGAALLFLAIGALAVSLLLWPYTTWGEPPHVRENVAAVISNLGLASIAAVLLAAFAVFADKANREGRKAMMFGFFLLLFGVLSAARIAWIHFWVLPPP